MPIITISGPLGARVREVGAKAAEISDIDYLDQAILVDAARRLGVPVEVMAQREEKIGSFGERLSSVLHNFLERSAAASATDPFVGGTGLEMLLAQTYDEVTAAPRPGGVDEERYEKTITSIITELASKGNIVIAGRGSQIILKNVPNALHCLCIAPQDYRARWVVERENLSYQAALVRARDQEKAWAGFHRRIFKADVYDHNLYDLVVNTGRLSLEAAAEAIAVAAKQKEHATKGLVGDADIE
jgi:cytidylate kinase